MAWKDILKNNEIDEFLANVKAISEEEDPNKKRSMMFKLRPPSRQVLEEEYKFNFHEHESFMDAFMDIVDGNSKVSLNSRADLDKLVKDIRRKEHQRIQDKYRKMRERQFKNKKRR